MQKLAVVLLLVAACATDDRKPPAVTIPKATPQETGALVLVLDRSGSMQGPKLDAVKEAATAAVDALDGHDQVAIVMFDSDAEVLVPLQASANRQQIAAEIARVNAGGGTQMLGALRSAHDILAAANAQVKHVILLSDGEAASEGLVDLATQMRQQKITLSTIGVAGADQHLLELLSTAGGGRTYQIDDLAQLPSAFVNETKLALK